MKIEKTEQPKNTIALTIELEDAEVRPYLERAAERLSQRRPVPGFRPGKVPYEIMRKSVGDDVLYHEALEPIVQATLPKAVEQEHLTTVGTPKIDIEKLAPGNPLIYKATVSLLPIVELGDYRSLKVHKKKIVVSDAEVEKLLGQLRRSRGKETLAQRPAQQGDKVEIDFNGYLDNVPIDGATSKAHPVVLGEGNFVPGFEEHLLGMQAGEKKEFTVRFPKDYHKTSLANRDVLFRVTVHSVFAVELPAADDAFAQSLGPYKTAKELREHLRKNLEGEKQEKERERFEVAMLDKIMEISKFGDLPDTLVEGELDKMLEELKNGVADQGMDYGHYLESIKKSEEELRKELRPQAERRLRLSLLTRKLADQENIAVAESEIDDEIAQTKKIYEGNAAVEQSLSSREYRSYLRNVLTGKQVFVFLDNLIGVEET